MDSTAVKDKVLFALAEKLASIPALSCFSPEQMYALLQEFYRAGQPVDTSHAPAVPTGEEGASHPQLAALSRAQQQTLINFLIQEQRKRLSSERQDLLILLKLLEGFLAIAQSDRDQALAVPARKKASEENIDVYKLYLETCQWMHRVFIHQLNNHFGSILPACQMLLEGAQEREQQRFLRIIEASAAEAADQVHQFAWLIKDLPEHQSVPLEAQLKVGGEILRKMSGGKFSLKFANEAELPVLPLSPVQFLTLFVLSGKLLTVDPRYETALIHISARRGHITIGGERQQMLFLLLEMRPDTQSQEIRSPEKANGTTSADLLKSKKHFAQQQLMAYARAIEARVTTHFGEKGEVKISVSLSCTAREMPRTAEAKTRAAKILYVDADPTLCEITPMLLKELGYQAEGVTSGKELIQRLHSQPGEYQVVILDVSLPDAPPEKILQALKKLKSTVPVVLSATYTNQNMLARLYGLNYHGILKKPFGLNDLKNCIENTLQQTSSLSANLG